MVQAKRWQPSEARQGEKRGTAIPLPPEHGGWAMLLVPLLIGWIVGAQENGNHLAALLFFLTALAFYLARPPLLNFLRWRGRAARHAEAFTMLRWSLIFASVGLLAGIAVLLLWKRWLLVLLAVPSLLCMGVWLMLALRRQQMSEVAELAGIAGLSVGAPAMAYVVGGVWQTWLFFALWLLSFLYFGGTVFYIKLKARQQPGGPPPPSLAARLRVGRPAWLWQGSALLIAALAVTFDLLPPLAPISLLPGALKTLYGALTWQSRTTLRMVRLGIIEIVHALLYGLLMVVAFTS